MIRFYVNSPDIAVRRKAVGIALDMVSSRNVDEVVGFLKKELSKTLDQDYELNMEYRQLLIQSIHTCAIRFSEVAASVVHVLMEFLGDSNNPSAVDVIAFVRCVRVDVMCIDSAVCTGIITAMNTNKNYSFFIMILQ